MINKQLFYNDMRWVYIVCTISVLFLKQYGIINNEKSLTRSSNELDNNEKLVNNNYNLIDIEDINKNHDVHNMNNNEKETIEETEDIEENPSKYGKKPSKKISKGPLFWLTHFIPSIVLTDAWNVAGHEAIGMTTMSGLRENPSAQLKRLLNNKDAVDVAGWTNLVNEKHPETLNLHYMLQKDNYCNEIDYNNCTLDLNNENDIKKSKNGKGLCLLNAIRTFYKKLENNDDNKPILLPNNIKLSDSDSLRYLISLIGDLHQPFHLGFNFDNGGKDSIINYKRYNVKLKANYHDFFDDILVNNIIADEPHLWYSGWTHVNTIKNEFLRDEKLFQQKKLDVFDVWAKDTFQILCKDQDLYKKQVIYSGNNENNGNNADGGKNTDSGKQNQQINDGDNQNREKINIQPDSYKIKVWNNIVKSQILLAGARTAIVLNHLLQSKEASKLRTASAVKDIEIEKRVSSNEWARNLGINLSIILFIGIIFAFLTKFFFSTPVPSPPPNNTEERSKEMDKKS